MTGVLILSDKSTAAERCKPNCVTPDGSLDPDGVDAVNRGKALLPINVAAWVVAGAGLGVGAYFLLTAKSSASQAAPVGRKATFLPIVDQRGAYGVLTTTF